MDDQWAALVGPHAASHGLDIEAIALSGTGPRRMLRITVDADGGAGIDAITALSRDLAEVLDTDPRAHELLGTVPYTLEVTSRGVASPLEHPRHWRRNLGRLVDVQLDDGDRFVGRIAGAADGRVVVTVQGTDRVLDPAHITRALVQVELNRKDV